MKRLVIVFVRLEYNSISGDVYIFYSANKILTISSRLSKKALCSDKAYIKSLFGLDKRFQGFSKNLLGRVNCTVISKEISNGTSIYKTSFPLC